MSSDFLINTAVVEVTSVEPSQIAVRQEIRCWEGARLQAIISAVGSQFCAELASLRSSDPHLFGEVLKHAFVLIDFGDWNIVDIALQSGRDSHLFFKAFEKEFGRGEGAQWLAKMASYRASREVYVALLLRYEDSHLSIHQVFKHGASLKSFNKCGGIESLLGPPGMNKVILYDWGPVREL